MEFNSGFQGLNNIILKFLFTLINVKSISFTALHRLLVFSCHTQLRKIFHTAQFTKTQSICDVLLCRLVVSSQEKGDIFFRNVGNCTPNGAQPNPTRLPAVLTCNVSIILLQFSLKMFLNNLVVRNWIHLAQEMAQRRAVGNKTKTLFLQYNQQDSPFISNYLFLQNALHISDGLSVHHQELKTAYTATVYVKQLLLPAAIAAGSSSCLTYTVAAYAVLSS